MHDTDSVKYGLDLLNSAIAAHAQDFAAAAGEDERAALLDDIRGQVRDQLAQRAGEQREQERAMAARRFAMQRRVGLVEQVERALGDLQIVAIQAVNAREQADVGNADPLTRVLDLIGEATFALGEAARDDVAVLESLA